MTNRSCSYIVLDRELDKCITINNGIGKVCDYMKELSGDNSDKSRLDEKLADFQAKCRRAGLKITPQRTAVYRVLAESKDHPSAETVCREVRKEMPNVSLDTVNRTLLTINEIGAAFTVEGSGDPKRYDGNMEDHQHFKCLKCKKIIDVIDEDFGDITPPSALDKAVILRKAIYFEGICDFCIEKSEVQ